MPEGHDSRRGPVHPLLWQPHGRENVVRLPATSSRHDAVFKQGMNKDHGNDQAEQLADEVPVALIYNCLSHAVMLATPSRLEDFALGFSLTEEILASPGDLLDCRIEPRQNGVNVHAKITDACFEALRERRRNVAGRTGCGLCGVENLRDVMRAPRPVSHRPTISVDAVHAALEALPDHQPLFRATGASHAAAWADLDGTIQLVREDVGRHNALDKLIGALVTGGVDTLDGFVVITSRASFEMVQKAAVAGIGLVVAVSAPTAFAARLADDSGVALVGWARRGRLTAYTYPETLGLRPDAVAAL